MSCGVGCRLSSDPALLWLWGRLAAVALFQPLALIRPLAWEPPNATGVALKSQKKAKNRKHTNKGPHGSRELLLWHSGLTVLLVSVEASVSCSSGLVASSYKGKTKQNNNNKTAKFQAPSCPACAHPCQPSKPTRYETQGWAEGGLQITFHFTGTQDHETNHHSLLGLKF